MRGVIKLETNLPKWYIDDMSKVDFKSTKLDRNQAIKKVKEILNKPTSPIFSKHALQELAADDLTIVDANNVLKSGDARILMEGELIKGSYRYRVETSKITIVVAFQPDGNGLVVVTGWRKKATSKR